MSFDVDAQVQFATQFALFLVALAGLALSLLRPELLTRSTPMRLVLAVGFAALGGAAFVHGSLILVDAADDVVVVSLVAGWVALAIGSSRWEGGRLSQRGVLAGVLLGLASVAAVLAHGTLAAAALRAAAAVAVGGALLLASRKAIAARVAASSAATLLLVVLVLSVGLSAVLSNTVEDQAVASIDARAVREASLIEEARTRAIERAQVASTGLASGAERLVEALRVIADTGVIGADQSTVIADALDVLTKDVYVGETLALAYADTRAGVVASSELSERDFAELVESRAARDATRTGIGSGDIVVLGDSVVALGVRPVQDGSGRTLGLVLAAVEIDAAYLQSRAAAEDAVSLAVWSGSRRIASFGAQPRDRVAAELAADVMAGPDDATRRTTDQFVAARAVRSQSNRPVLVLLAARPTTVVDDVRARLFRTFFVIAFGGALLSLVLASIVGDRIGAGVRRLTTSAEQLERGEAGVRSGVRSEDEVGRLGTAFDSMAASIEEKTDALRQAALDEARLRNRVEAIVAGMGEALVAVDEAGVVTDLNQAGEELLGVSASEARGRPVTEVVRLRNDEGADLSERLDPRDGSRWSELGDIVDAAGDLVPIAITAGPLAGPTGEVSGRVFVVRDLRAEREVERMKREFLSRVGHELRTPLTPLLGYARILAGREVPPDRAREISQAMVSSGQRLERIVEMLEFFASAQAGRTVLRPDAIDVRDLLGEVIDARAPSSNGHVLARRVRSGTPRILGDPYWLRRSIDELIDNSIKFSPAGGRITVTAGPVDGHVEIAVRDTGVGMSPDEVERAFAEWTQGDESDTRAYGGLGLGLALVQRVAERHGGRVACETAPGKGSKFSILLPALTDDTVPGAPADSDRGS